MPALSRRRSLDDPHRETWLIYFGDVRGGSIGRRAGVPNSAPQWGWSCGFYPGSEPGDHRSGVAETFDEARTGFEAAWQKLSATWSEADYEARRRERDCLEGLACTGWLCRCRLNGRTGSPAASAEMVTTRTLDRHVRAAHHLIPA